MKGIINKALFAMLISANFVGSSYSMDTINTEDASQEIYNHFVNAFSVAGINAATKTIQEIPEVAEVTVEPSIIENGITAGKNLFKTNLLNRGLNYTVEAGKNTAHWLNNYCIQPSKNVGKTAYNTGKHYVVNGAQFAHKKYVDAYNNGAHYLKNNVTPFAQAHSGELAAGTAGVITGAAYEAGLVGKVGRGIKRMYTYAKNNPVVIGVASLSVATPALMVGYEYNTQLLAAIKHFAPFAKTAYATVFDYVKANYPALLKNAGIYTASTFGTIGANRARLAIANRGAVAAQAISEEVVIPAVVEVPAVEAEQPVIVEQPVEITAVETEQPAPAAKASVVIEQPVVEVPAVEAEQTAIVEQPVVAPAVVEVSTVEAQEATEVVSCEAIVSEQPAVAEVVDQKAAQKEALKTRIAELKSIFDSANERRLSLPAVKRGNLLDQVHRLDREIRSLQAQLNTLNQ